jgi:hypothetical protein
LSHSRGNPTGYQKKLEDLVKAIQSHGYEVHFVTEKLHDYAAQNPRASKEMHWPCGDHEFQVLATESPKDQYSSLKHELIEFYRMRPGGPNHGDYHGAHIVALRDEDKPMSAKQAVRLLGAK